MAVALCAYCREADAGERRDADGDPICADCAGDNRCAECDMMLDRGEADDDGLCLVCHERAEVQGDDDTCGHCYGSGGGPDAALICRHCGGTGRAGDTDLDRATYDEWRWEQRRDDRMCGSWD